MDKIQNEVFESFSEEHFASDYERYSALILARMAQISRALTAQLFTDWERRNLLALPARADDVEQRYRLSAAEVDSVTAALRNREQAILAGGAFRAPVFRNVAALGERLGLSACEQALLVLSVIGATLRVLREALERLSAHLRDRASAARGLATLLQYDVAVVRQALAPQATLVQSGLLRLNLHEEDEALLRPRDGLAPILFDDFDAPQALFTQFTQPARAATLSGADFEHLGQDLEVLTALLGNAAASGAAGVNVMLYGPPGTGKTELARVLAARAGLTLYEIRHSEASGEAMTRARYSQVIVAQRLMRTVSGALLMFDETEDLLPARGGSSDTLGKAAFNELLETNPVPMLWISNEIWQIDAAYLRRFAFLLEVKNPTQKVRNRIAQRAFAALDVDAPWLQHVAQQELAPGQMTQAARVARLVGGAMPAAQAAERTWRASMRALDQRPTPAARSATSFDLRYLNCNAEAAVLVARLAECPSASMVFYGPPGTGKTALTQHIADAADRPLLVKRASDLLSPWVGVCEKNIARAFEQAQDDDAVLTIDEAESFLTDRRDARARWELTETNELLTQMERFDGLFICSTNLLERLDKAALRRFAIKLRFDYLRPEQARGLVAAALRDLGVPDGIEQALARVDSLQRLTPGDVAAALKRCRILGAALSAEEFVQALCEEVALKGEGSLQRVGFY